MNTKNGAGMLTTKELLTEAKNRILNHGWIQLDYGSKDQGFCATGAVDSVAEGLFDQGQVTDIEAYELYRSGEEALRRTLRDTGRITNIVAWNDASHRTKQDVLDLFDEAASRAAGV